VKHVFVETNFLVEVLRPLPTPQKRARDLLKRREQGEITLYIPWCSVTKVRRTLIDIIRRDLGFHDEMQRFAGLQMKAAREAKREAGFDNREIKKLKALAENATTEAIKSKNDRISHLVASLEIIQPSERVIEKTMEVCDIKTLKPFDEMVLGAVLARAEELQQAGERDLHFCTLDKSDLGPANNPNLKLAYDQCGLIFHADFSL